MKPQATQAAQKETVIKKVKALMKELERMRRDARERGIDLDKCFANVLERSVSVKRDPVMESEGQP